LFLVFYQLPPNGLAAPLFVMSPTALAPTTSSLAPAASATYDKLQQALRDMFMLDKATELDFGIYRIIRQRRAEIDQFLNHDLLPQVQQALTEHLSSDSQALRQELATMEKNIRDMGFEPDTSEKVQALRARLGQASDVEGLQNEVFSLLLTFFRRYYDKGDFVSQRRYKRDVYAIPYEGEEVKLYWANHDQYYIKTAEYLKHYQVRVGGEGSPLRLVLELVDAQLEQGNNKTQGEQVRRFVLHEAEPLTLDGDILRLRFRYELREKGAKQGTLLEEAVAALLPQLPAAFAALAQPAPSAAPKAKAPAPTLLERHLRDYTARHTFDYFIHKDLQGFLTRELDFFLKSEVLLLDDLLAGQRPTAADLQQRLGRALAVRRVGEQIIDFLAQLENFQKKLWLKKKLVVETNYCVTLDRVPPALYPTVAANATQVAYWRKNFAIQDIKADTVTTGYQEPLPLEFLQQNLYLPVDTAFFDEEFKTQLVGSFENLDEELDGLLVNSENFQALNLLQARYREQVDCVYIDPPYNTDKDDFLYKDSYKHSSWLSLMEDRVKLGQQLIHESGLFFASIDYNEANNLKLLLNSLFGESNSLAELIWDLGSGTQAGHFTRSHEYIFSYTKKKEELENFDTTEEGIIKHGALKKISRSNPASEITFPAGFGFEGENATFTGELGGSEKQYIIDGPMVFENGKLAKEVTLKAGWAMKKQVLSIIQGKETFDSKGQRVNRFFFNKQGVLWYEKERGKMNPKTVISDAGGTKGGTTQLKNFFRSEDIGDKLDKMYPKSTKLLTGIIGLGQLEGTVMDYFAGSGTTANAVIELNRDNTDSSRKYILVEMGEYFDTVTKPRVLKAAYSREWKNGKPVARDGISQVVKYMRLESYEDTLNNLELHRPAELQLALDTHTEARHEYLLRYLLDTESRGSLLSLDWFENPFDVRLHITRKYEMTAVPVDLVETFNYLLGLVVERHYTQDGYRVVRGRTRALGAGADEQRVLVVWRNVQQHDHAALLNFLKGPCPDNPWKHPVHYLFVNGDHTLPNLAAAVADGDGESGGPAQVRLIEAEFRQRLFNGDGTV
jgi:adenine-specific DNA-methyltransferase